MRRLAGSLLLGAPSLLVATPPRVPCSVLLAWPPALQPVGLRHRVRLGPWAPCRPLCDCSWALRCLSLCRSWALSCSVCPLSWSLCCLLLLLLVGLRCRFCLGPPPFLRPLVGALRLVALPFLVTPLLCVLPFDDDVVPPILLCLRLRFHLSTGVWALLRLVCAVLWGECYLELCRSRLLLGSACRPSWLPCCLLLCARGAPPTPVPGLVGTPLPFVRLRARFAALCPFALGRSFALCAVFRCYFAASGSIAHEAPLSPMPELAGAPLPLVRRLVGAVLVVAPPVVVATPL